MSFVRSLNKKQITALHNDKNSTLFNLLKNDIKRGIVFPAIRKNQIYFYYEGGCLYNFSNGVFLRDKQYEKYGYDESLSSYELAKKQIENKFTNASGDDKERRLLNSLYSHTFNINNRCNIVVLDIEVNLNGLIARGKKCDLVLYNVPSREMMFVEGKVFSDNRVNVKCGNKPKVIAQVNEYSAAINEQKEVIISQYGNYINLINKLFDTDYPVPQKLIQPAKLLVYETPFNLTENNLYSINTISATLGTNNVVWFNSNERPSIDEVWNKLCK